MLATPRCRWLAAGLLNLAFASVAAAAAPSATTSGASSITSNGTSSSAVFNGSGNPNGEATIGYFRYDVTSPGACNDIFGTRVPASSGTALGSGTSTVSYSITASNLVAGTTYYFCAITNNPSGTAFGAVVTFTIPGPPVVTTQTQTNLTAFGATLNGTANPTAATTTAWFRYDVTNPVTCNDTFGTRVPSSGGTSAGSGTTAVAYSYAISLQPATVYYYCAIASNTYGTSFGTVASFSTPATVPTTATTSASGVTSSTATLNGWAAPNGDSATGWFRYSTASPGSCNDTFGTRVPGSGGTALGTGDSAVTFSQALTGLAPGTLYYFCAIAQNSFGTTFGNVFNFSTPALVPTVTTVAASGVAGTSATLNGTVNPNGSASTGWFRYSTSSPGTCNDTFGTRVPSSSGTGIPWGNSAVAYSQSATGLSPATTYYFCAIASNSMGTTFGSILSFTTPATAPLVVTSSATSILGTTATLNGSAAPEGDPTTGYFRYDTVNPGSCNDTFGTRAPASGGTSLGAGLSFISYSQAISGLTQGTTYYYCAIAQNSFGTSFGFLQSFTTAAPPTVTTVGSSGVSNTAAGLSGFANANGEAATGWFRYSTTNPGSCNDTFGARAPATGGTPLGTGTASFNQSITGLLPQTTYYFCAIASNGEGTGFGAVMSFLTQDMPTVTTLAATNVQPFSATLNSTVNPNGNGTYAEFVYGTTNPGTCNNTFGTVTSQTYLGSGTTSVSYTLSTGGALLPATTYYFCVIANNSWGTSYGSVLSFSTPATAPTTVTNFASSVTSSSATLNGSAAPNGDPATGWFRYSTTNPGVCNDTFGTRVPSSGGTVLGSGDSSVAFSQAISGLTPGTNYYFCAIAQNSFGTTFGNVGGFTASATAPTVTTVTASGVTATGATLNGTVNPNGSASTGWFRYSTSSPGTCNDTFGTRAPSFSGTSIPAGNSPVAYSQTLTNQLAPATTYYYCAIASNGVGTSFGSVMSFTTSATAPLVTTSTVTSITGTAATLNGSANPDGDPTTGYFRYDTVNPGSCNDTFGTRAPSTGGTSLGSSATAFINYSQAISGLTQGTTYYYCAIAQNSFGTAFGSVFSFVTAAPPTVTTSGSSSVTNTSAFIMGYANPNESATTGYFRISTTNPGTCNDTFGTRMPATGGTALGSGTSSVNFNQSLTGLSPQTTYYYCAIATSAEGIGFGTVLSFLTQDVPTVTTLAATNVQAFSATLNSTVTPNGNGTYAEFVFGTTNPGTCNNTFGTVTSQTYLGTGTTSVSYSLSTGSSLLPATTYYFCVIANNSWGTSYGSVLSFTTPATLPTTTTNSASALTSSSATLNGWAAPNGDPATGWFRYSTTNPGGCNDTFGTRVPSSGGTALGSGDSAVSFSQGITGLTPGTAYYFCAIAQNSFGTGFGSVIALTTLANPPTVTTVAASSVAATFATLNATVNPNGGATTGWFRYSTTNPGTCTDTFGTRAPLSGGSSIPASNSTSPYTQLISGLAPGNTYYYCAIASNSAGAGLGSILSFTTPPVAPVVSTATASAVGSTTATLNGSVNPGGAATTAYFRYDVTNPGSCNDTFGTRYPASGGTSISAGNSSVAYSLTPTGLTPGTLYYYCAVAVNSAGTGFGLVFSFTTLAAPTVNTLAATPVTATAATLNANANPNLAATTGWFRYDVTNPVACNDTFGTRVPSSSGSSLGSGSTSVSYSFNISALSPATTYYFCAIASNSVGTSFGSVLSFTTPATVPTVTVQAPSPLSGTTATLNGSADPDGDPTTAWFRYSTTSPGSCNDTFGTRTPATGGSTLGGGNTAVAFSQAVTGLTAATTYYVCAIASNSFGTSFSSVLSFTTPTPPAVTTTAATGVGGTTATVNGSANPDFAATTGWFRYDITSPGTCNDTFGTRAPGSGGTSLGSGSTAVTYSQALTGLSPGTTYYFCAIASNSEGTSFGSVLTFTTPAAPTVTTSAATLVASTTATLNGSANPNLAATTGWFRYDVTNPGTCSDTFGTRAPTSGGSSLGSGSTAASYTQNVTGLAPGTTYYFCAIASNSVGTSFGSVLTFTTTAPPAVSTVAASSIGSTSATLNGSANPDLASTTGWFRYSTINPGSCSDTFGTRAPSTGGAALGSGSTAVSYSQGITGLAAATTYYFCAIASNAGGTSFGSVMSFTTPTVPAVVTSAASAVADTVATLNGSANPQLASTTGWFRYSTTSPGTCNDTFGTRAPSTGGTSLGAGGASVAYSQAISGLSPATTYYFCAIASNSVGTSFGSVLSFTTLAAPVVTTSAASSVADTVATLNGSANPKLAATTGWFRYDVINPGTCNDTFGTRAPASGGTSLGSGSTAASYSQALTGLTAGTTYYFCAIASNSVGTSFGSVLTFTTLAAPTVTSSAATLVASTTATLNGSANPNLAATTGWFRYDVTNPGSCSDTFGTRAPASGGTSLGSGSTAASYTQNVIGLSAGTTYYFCAIASNSVGTSFGSVLTFTTTAAPTVTTSAASGVADTVATLNGSANPNLASATGWFRYSTINPGSCSDTFGTRAPASGGTSLGSGNLPVSYSQGLSGLSPGMTYYFCAIASNSVGTAFGSLLSFTTQAAPSVTTASASSVADTLATLNGSANPNLASATGWFRYSTVNPGACNDTFGTRAPASGGTSLGAGSTSVAYSQALTGLTAGTTYYFCAIASNSVGTSFGAVTSFTTLAAPTVATSAASAVAATVATLNGSANPNLAATTGWFRYDVTNPGSCSDTFGTRAPASGGTSLGSGNTAVSYSQALSGLSPGTTYYFCAIALNSVGPSFGSVLSFTTLAAPTVSTGAATGVADTVATLNGSANPNLATTTAWFRYSTTSPGTCNDTFGTRAPSSGGSSLGAGGSAVAYTQSLTGLSPATTYYYCAIASNSVGTSFGAVQAFTTLAVPTVVTAAASGVADTFATLNGSVNPNLAATTAWFRYDVTNPGTCNDTFGTRAPASGGSSLGSGNTAASYSLAVTTLSPATTYYYCAIASNSVGTSFGAVQAFTTLGAPAVTTTAANAIADTVATLNGSANPNGASTTAWFRYDATNPGTCNDTFGTRAPASGGSSLGSGNTATTFSQSLTGLTAGTTYYFCAIASNAIGVSFGSVLSFTTESAPVVTTAAASAIGNTTATLNGSASPGLSATTGWFRYDVTSPGTCNDTFGTRAPSSGGTSLGSGSTSATYSQALTGLAPGTTYYYCAIASNSIGTSFGGVMSFTTFTAPTVTTSAATAVTSTAATLSGSANPNGVATTAWFRYDVTNPGVCSDTFGTRAPASGGSSLGAGTSPLSYSQGVTGLAAATTYYYCAIASSSSGTSFGAVVSFTTQAAPAVTTVAASGVADTVATLNGSANPNLAATTGWFRFSTTNPVTCNDTFGTRAPTSGGTSLGSGSSASPYAQSLVGLAPATTYYFCAIASNSVGTSFGAVMSFTTLAAPTVATSAASGVADTVATLNGSANPNLAATAGWFRYDVTNPGACNDTFGVRAPVSGGTSLGSGNTAGTYSQSLTGLSPGTTYYFCAIASNSVGTSFGSVLSFTTLAAPTVTTVAASSVSSAAATLNGSANPNLAATTGWFRYSTTSPGACNDTFGTRAPATGGSFLGSGNTAAPFSQSLTGLGVGTTYYFCAIASNSVGTSFGTVMSFTTQAAPAVTTVAASGVADTLATLNASVNPNLAATTGWFRYAAASPGTCNDTFGTRAPALGGSTLGAGSTATPYSQSLSGLSPGTTYYFCAIASNSVGTSFGAVLSFTTLAAPTVTTSSASAIADTVATLNGSASPNLAAATGWFRYSTSSPGSCNDTFGTRAPATGGASLGSGGTAAPYSQALTGLSPGTTYYFCAIASNSVGTSFGAVMSFTTLAAPTVTTSAASGVADTVATLNGSANPNLAAATGWFRYDVSSPGTCNDTFGTRAPASGGTSVGSGSTAAGFSQALTGLSPGTTYYFCAIASNSVGTSFGSVLSFTTLAAPAVTTIAASGVGGTAATLNGSANPGLASTTGWFRYDVTNPGTCNDTFGTRTPASGGASLGAGSTATPYAQALSGLTPGTTYYFCAIASNSVGTSFGTVLSFVLPAAPLVTTSPVSGVTASSVTLSGSANPGLASTTGWFRYATTSPGTCNDTFGTRAPATGGTNLGAGGSAVPYTQSLSGLPLSTTFYVCAIASNSVGTSFGAVLAFTTPAAPAVNTTPATAVTSTSATLNGSANPNWDPATGWFRYDVTNPGTCNDTFGTRAPASGGTSLGSGGTSASYSQAVTGLSPATTYYVCAIASNSYGTSVGPVLSFTTVGPPVVTTSSPTNVTPTGATLNASANPMQDAATGWFRYDVTNPGTCNDTFGTRSPASGGTSLGAGAAAVAYSQSVSGLTQQTTYYFCAIASNSFGTSFGSVMSFTSGAPPPTVTTAPATGVGAGTATLEGSANPNGTATNGWFRYDVTSPGTCNDTFGTRVPGTAGFALGSGTAAASYSAALTGLQALTTYYYCAIASNQGGAAFGSVLSFTTSAAPPQVTTIGGTQVTGSNSWSLKGTANPNGAASTGWFRYSTTNPGTCNDTYGTRAPASGGTQLGAGMTAVSFTQTLSGLQTGTYYLCALASNSSGTSFGQVVTFETGVSVKSGCSCSQVSPPELGLALLLLAAWWRARRKGAAGSGAR